MGVLAAAVAFARMSAAGAIAAAVFGGAALFFAESLVLSLDRGERASFESAWGGLGGGLGGWRLTTPLVYLIATAIFGALLMVVAVREMPPVAPAGVESAGAEDPGGDASAGDDETDAGGIGADEGDAGDNAGDTDAGDTDDQLDSNENGEPTAGDEPAAQP